MGYNPFIARFRIGIGDLVFPGHFEFEGLKTSYDWELTRVRGHTGAVAPKFLGTKNHRFSIVLTLVTAEEYAVYTEIKRRFPPPKGGEFSLANNYSVPVYHPLLNEEYGIDQVVIEEAPNPVKDPSVLKYTATISVIAVPPPAKKVTSKVSGAPIPTVDAVAKQSPRQKEIDEERQKLGIVQDAIDRQSKVRDSKLEQEVGYSLSE